jgi:hypothetical protein
MNTKIAGRMIVGLMWAVIAIALSAQPVRAQKINGNGTLQETSSCAPGGSGCCTGSIDNYSYFPVCAIVTFAITPQVSGYGTLTFSTPDNVVYYGCGNNEGGDYVSGGEVVQTNIPVTAGQTICYSFGSTSTCSVDGQPSCYTVGTTTLQYSLPAVSPPYNPGPSDGPLPLRVYPLLGGSLIWIGRKKLRE